MQSLLSFENQGDSILSVHVLTKQSSMLEMLLILYTTQEFKLSVLCMVNW